MLNRIAYGKRYMQHATQRRFGRGSVPRLAVALVGALGVLAIGARAASAQGTPPQFGSVSSGTPTSTSLTVAAAIIPGGQDTTYIVDYGATPSYGYSTAAADAGAGSSLVNSSVTVPNLAPGDRVSPSARLDERVVAAATNCARVGRIFGVALQPNQRNTGRAQPVKKKLSPSPPALLA